MAILTRVFYKKMYGHFAARPKKGDRIKEAVRRGFTVCQCAGQLRLLEPSYPATNFTRSHDWNILSSKSNLFYTASDQRLSSCNPNFIFYHYGQLHHLWPPFCFCQINLEKFCIILHFDSHMHSSWDLPFNSFRSSFMVGTKQIRRF